MVLNANLRADHRPTRDPGRAGPWRDPFGPPSHRPPAGGDQRLACLAGSAELVWAAVVDAGEAS